MRASFLLVLVLALLVGLGVASYVKYAGLLNPPPAPPVAPQPVVPTAAAPPAPMVVSTIGNVFAGDAFEPGFLQRRAAKPEEIKEMESNKNEYLPPNEAIAYFRTATRNIEAGTALKKSDLADLAKPEALHTRLTPGTRAFGISLPKSQSAGGLIQVGDWVDVYLSTEVGRTDSPAKNNHTGLLVKSAQVVAKRDTLHKIYSGLTGDLVQFTVAANPYRTALLEYGRNVGVLSMVPVSKEEKQKLDSLKEAAANDPTKALALIVGDLDVAEGREEMKRVEAATKGEVTIGNDDLARILKLKPIEAPPAPPAPPTPMPMIPPPVVQPSPPPPPTTIEVFTGTTRQPAAVFASPEPTPPPTVVPPVIVIQPPPPPPPAPKAGEYFFVKPAEKPTGK